ncbi:hypothetical protein IBE20_00720 [Francisella tularensis subsp. novicida]|uniref:Uncharacterized protein n=1 Tax=Francisella tularensis subsp. novicida (strain ATCC 15482 / CCUG 33449 / U112) TaxID=401614 RepID=A0Q6G2_FRATN|nr:hypothetical protein [Francisella tularensis]ABK89827.1 hypothetical protein FTN_0939 [Francisella tularensis subsp. novicida U112]AJI61045.1 hypothetical protein AW25_1073 [Francisella tularensis subsp. novicida U112]EDX27416.1 hypothetical protein FTE_1187 [Francisella tularensis subsp. novicida FTE]MBK2035278.1 hypothetical protein [Francisella tularensis subsp. novicida]MBK2116763.1 hypothetical protein [Francisella tularensis subsp. novicida]
MKEACVDRTPEVNERKLIWQRPVLKKVVEVSPVRGKQAETRTEVPTFNIGPS